jgi:hypothetical protein
MASTEKSTDYFLTLFLIPEPHPICIMKHPVPNPIPGLFSFGTPCLRWKIIEAVMAHNGFPGFMAPYRTRYGNMLVTYSVDNRPLGGGFGVQTSTQLFTIDRLTGARTPGSFNEEQAPYLPFPYNTGLPGSDTTSIWEVSETRYVHTVVQPFTGVIVTADVQLSNPFTLSQLEADADALLATIDVSKVDWFTLVSTSNDAFADPTNLLPAQYMYGGLQIPGPVAIPTLRAGAWSALLPGPVGDESWQPNIYAKAVGYFAMAGNYCRKTFLVDYIPNPISNSCASGRGSCGNEFKVEPPTPTDNVNSYVLVVPNCVCG